MIRGSTCLRRRIPTPPLPASLAMDHGLRSAPNTGGAVFPATNRRPAADATYTSGRADTTVLRAACVFG